MINKYGYTPATKAADLILTKMKEIHINRAIRMQDQDYDEFEEQVSQCIARMHNALFEESGLNGLALDETLAV